MEFDLGREALIASGAKVDEAEGSLGLAGLEELLRRFRETAAPAAPEGLAGSLFRWLWQTKPHRYQRGGEFRLHRVIAHQLSPRRQRVGNCLGLTLLYNVLARRLGLPVGTVYLEQAFGLGPHTFSLLYLGPGGIDVENIFPTGFDYKGHRGNPLREEWGEAELVAEVYTARGNRLFDRGDMAGAVKHYESALALSPNFTKAIVNRAIAQARLEAAGFT